MRLRPTAQHAARAGGETNPFISHPHTNCYCISANERLLTRREVRPFRHAHMPLAPVLSQVLWPAIGWALGSHEPYSLKISQGGSPARSRGSPAWVYLSQPAHQEPFHDDFLRRESRNLLNCAGVKGKRAAQPARHSQTHAQNVVSRCRHSLEPYSICNAASRLHG